MAVFFLSDTHLGARYIDNPRRHQQLICDWLDRVRPQAEALYLLGDILDYWFEYRDVVPRGYVRFFAALARWTDAGIPVVWLHGNHDIWTTDYFSRELGITVHDGILDTNLLGHRFVMEHGDGVGLKSASFHFLRRLFRSSLARRLFAALHPRLTMPFAFNWSASNRTSRTRLEANCFQQRALDSLANFARDYERETDGEVDHFMFGHLHCAVNGPLTDYRPEPGKPNPTLTVLPDGFSAMGYARFDGQAVTLHSLLDDTPLESGFCPTSSVADIS